MTDPNTIEGLKQLLVPEGWGASQALKDLIVGRMQAGPVQNPDIVQEAQKIDQLLHLLSLSQLEVINHIGAQQQAAKNLQGLGNALKNLGKSR